MRSWAVAVVAGFVGFATQASAQSGDATRGQRVFNQQCRACHTLEKDGASTVGPNLHGVFGRKAGTAPGFSYSPALKNSGIVWTEDNLMKWIENAPAMVPGTPMPHVSISDPPERYYIVAYLKSLKR